MGEVALDVRVVEQVEKRGVAGVRAGARNVDDLPLTGTVPEGIATIRIRHPVDKVNVQLAGSPEYQIASGDVDQIRVRARRRAVQTELPFVSHATGSGEIQAG